MYISIMWIFVLMVLVVVMFLIFSCSFFFLRSEWKRQEKMAAIANNYSNKAGQRIILLEQERYKDFSIRWNVSMSWVEMAFVSFNLDQEEWFQNWTPEQFHLWFNAKRESEGLFESVVAPKKVIDPKTEQMVDSLFKGTDL